MHYSLTLGQKQTTESIINIFFMKDDTILIIESHNHRNTNSEKLVNLQQTKNKFGFSEAPEDIWFSLCKDCSCS
jgi:hypothetical protein